MLRRQSHLLSAVRAAWPPLRSAPSLHHRILYSAAAKSTAPWPPHAAASLRHFLLYSTASAGAGPKPTTPFVVEDYLVATCGLTPAQARRSSKHLAHLKSPSNPDAVLAFLAGIGLDGADVAAAIARDPRLLCTKVDGTQAHRNGLLRDMGLSTPQVSRLVTLVPRIFSSPSQISHLAFYMSFLGSYDKVHNALKKCPFLLGRNPEDAVKPSMAFLRLCGLTEIDIGKLIMAYPRMLNLQVERLGQVVECADKLGVPRESKMFWRALAAIYCFTPGRVVAKLHFLKKVLGCSEAEVRIAVGKMPSILALTEDRLSRAVEFLRMEVGLKAAYIVRRPALLGHSINTRLIPRHNVLKVLKEKGLVRKDVDFCCAVAITGEKFVQKFVDPYKDSVPGLADAYATACAGQVPAVIQP